MTHHPATEIHLTTEDFHTAVYQLQPSIAVFDCDGTLWSGDAGSAFMIYSVESGLLSREAADWLDARYRLYKLGQVSELAICGEMVQVYAGLAESELRQAARDFFRSHIEHNIFPSMHQLVASMQVRGTDIWAVSSTNDWVIEEGMKHFDIAPDHILCARVKIVDGLVTNCLLDVPTDEGKVAALARAGVTAPHAVFGNSIHDAAMLSIAHRAFPVNPTPALAERSTKEGWPMYYPQSGPVHP